MHIRVCLFFLLPLVACSVLAAADCNGNGIEDENEIAADVSRDCDVNGVPDECEAALLTFGFREERSGDFDLGDEEPRAVASGDFDGDGRLDVAIGNVSGSISIFIGEEGDAFTHLSDVAAGSLNDLEAVDLDGDGDLDLALAGNGRMAVLDNQGGGALAEPVEYTVARGTTRVESGDVNQDGAVDLVALSRIAHDILVFINLGDGTLVDGVVYEGGQLPAALVVADLDGDQAPDLATVNERTSDVSIFINLGDGTYDTATQIPLEVRPNALAGGDFNEDGVVDLAITTEEELEIWFNPGDGKFAAASVRYSGPAASVLSTDLNSDDRVDLVWASVDGRRVHFAENLAGGGFGEASTVIVNVQELAAGDVDEDGVVDLILPTRAPNLATVLYGGVTGNAAVDFTTSIADIGQEPHHAHLADVDQDGDLDALTGNGDNVSYSILINDGTGTFAPPRTRPLAALLDPPPDRESPSRVDVLQTGDLDGDGIIDLVMADGWRDLIRVFYGNGDGTFDGLREFPSGQGTFNHRLGDLEGDGDLDLVVTLSGENGIAVLFNDGQGGLDERVFLTAGDGPFGATSEDLNGDGIDDFVVTNQRSADVFVFLSNGDGTFEEHAEYPVGQRPRSVIAADFDEDGDPDLLTSNALTRDLTVILNRGDGTFGPPSATWMRLIPFDAAAVDVNADGHLDVATANEENHTLSVAIGRGDGTFLPPFQLDNNTGRGLRFVLAGDLNLDGFVDLVGANRQSQDLTVHLNQLGTYPVFLEDFTEQICTGQNFRDWSIETGSSTSGGRVIDRAMKYTLPAREDPALLGTLFHNVVRFPLHQEFLQAVFPDRFPSLTAEDYIRVTGRRATRDYYVGVISRLRRSDGVAYGFSVLVDGSVADETLTQEEVGVVWEALRQSFTLEPLGYFPQTTSAREAAEGWQGSAFPIYIEDAPPTVSFEAYTSAVGYGRVRILDAEQFAEANDLGQISFQTILVLSEAPRDIEGVVGGVVTAQPQGELSHVAIRTARRQTPNAFVADATETFATYAGKLVRLEVTAADYSVQEATLEEAEGFWAENRPQLSQLPQFDGRFAELSSLTEIAQMDLEAAQEVRFGGKATNLARLGRILEGSEFEAFREVGFGVPIHFYLEFLRTNTIPSSLDPERDVTYEEFLLELFAQEDFLTDSTARFAALDEFRDFARENGAIDASLIERIRTRIGEIFPSTSTPVRFRSSSNVEDALEFNGAGLYESTGGCAADDLDDDEEGPSLCDPSKETERTISRALRKVWTSLYTFRAFEERAFYGIPENQVGMGILVSRAFPDELANGVCFTGNFSNPADRRFIVTAQLGEESVVSPNPGVLPEKDILDVRDGEVVEIIRPQQGSTLVEPGTWVISDEHLRTIGRFLAFVDREFPLDLGEHARDAVLLDLEFKVEPDNSLAFKQVRPFLLAEPPPPAPEFELQIPEGRVVCGMFAEAGLERGPRDEYELKSQIRLRGGNFALPTIAASFEEELLEEVRFGPEQEIAESMGPGRFRVVSLPGGDGTIVYRFTYEKLYVLSDGRQLDVAIRAPVTFRARGDEALDPPLVLDENFFTVRPGSETLQAQLDGVPLLRYGSCEQQILPQFEIRIELEDGTRVTLEERFEEQVSLFETGPASLQSASVEVAGEVRTVTDYWRLVYSAFRHNTRVRYWVVFERPLNVPALEREVAAIELEVPEDDVEEPRASYLDEDFEVLAQVGLASFQKTARGEDPPFIRGDVTGDGSFNVADAVRLLDYLFRRGERLGCRTAADANNDGRLNIVDPLTIASGLFRGAVIPAPFPECGAAPPLDGLSCEGFAGCE